MKKLYFAMVAVLGILMLAVIPSEATVTGQPVSKSVNPGTIIRIPLELAADQQVAGVNGVFTYNTAIFTNPRMDIGPGSSSFIVESHERTDDPGNFRYVIYANPTAKMRLTAGPVAYFILTVRLDVADSTITDLVYSQSAASSPVGESLADVSFANAQIQISTGLDEWALYE